MEESTEFCRWIQQYHRPCGWCLLDRLCVEPPRSSCV
jgi:hypothetical protein